MKTHTFESKDQWEEFRKGKITGTKLKDITNKRGVAKKIGFYELIAERMGIFETEENAMARGLRLEPEAIAEFEKLTGKTVKRDLLIWTSEFSDNIAVSPDGVVDDLEAVEVKCLSSARHIQAIIEKEFPDEYTLQARQYFVCNEKLQKLNFVMYDPRIVAKPIVVFEIMRSGVEPDVQESLAYELQTLSEVDDWVAELSGF